MEDTFRDQNVLVTGAAGFIASHLCDALVAQGAKVYGVDNYLTGRKSNLEQLLTSPNFTLIEDDVNQEPSNYLPSDIAFQFVFHLASPASPPRYQAHPVETYLVNSLATHYLLQHLRDKNPQARFIFASTSEVYGDPQVHPQPESYWGNVNPNGPRSCYDEAKRLGESICGVHARDFKMNVRIARIFNTYGPRMDPDDGRVIPQFMMEALQHKSFSIQGDGSQTRSYCYVSDLVKGLLLLASVDAAQGQTINLGNPEEFTISQTAQTIHQLVNGEDQALQIETKPLPQDDPTRRRPDITKAQQVLNWQPQVTFAQGLALSLDYFKSCVK